jgi:AraC family transcriptional regulator of arabinose operon
MGCADHREPISLASLALTVHLSGSRFAHLFRQQTGVSPVQMLRSIRLQKAGVILSSSRVPLKELAAALGFRTAAYFGRAFKAHHGVTPGEYRRSHR